MLQSKSDIAASPSRHMAGAAAAMLALAVFPPSAFAHASESGHVLLLPTGYYLAGGALAATFVRAQLTNAGALERLLVVFVAVLGKWAVMALLLAWLVGGPYSFDRLGAVAAVESALTVLAGLLVLPWSAALLERSRVLQKELL